MVISTIVVRTVPIRTSVAAARGTRIGARTKRGADDCRLTEGPRYESGWSGWCGCVPLEPGGLCGLTNNWAFGPGLLVGNRYGGAWTPCALWIDRHEYKNAPSIISFQMWLGLCGSGILISLLLPYRVTVDDLAVAGLVREAFLALAGIGVPTTVIPLSIRLRSQLRRTFNTARQTGGADSD